MNPPKKTNMKSLQDAYRLQTLIWSARHWNLVREFSLCWFKLRDQRSILGLLWSFLNPLIMSAIMYFLFKSRMDRAKEGANYFLYILIGSVAWNYFATSIQSSLGVLVRKAYMMRNVIFPKEILVFSQIGVFLIQHILELTVVFLFIVLHKIGFSIHIIGLPFIILIEGILIIGITMILACVCVYAHDAEHIWAVFARMGLFMVPIFYYTDSLSPQFRWIVIYNPLTQIISFYRDILLYHRWPPLIPLALTTLLALLIFAGAYKFFKFMEPHMVERA